MQTSSVKDSFPSGQALFYIAHVQFPLGFEVERDYLISMIRRNRFYMAIGRKVPGASRGVVWPTWQVQLSVNAKR